LKRPVTQVSPPYFWRHASHVMQVFGQAAETQAGATIAKIEISKDVIRPALWRMASSNCLTSLQPCQ
jgi:hypothetical protein